MSQLIVAVKKSRTPESSVTKSSGNVFADLGLKDADTLMAKSVANLAVPGQDQRVTTEVAE
jgi:hypothetical protein